MGIGSQGLAKALFAMRVPFTSEKALDITAAIQETIYYAAVSESVKLAKVHGRWDEHLKPSPLKRGIFQFDGHENVRFSGRYDWEALRADVKRHGTRNSLFVAIVPTATTSQILNNTEACEQLASNLYTRKVLAGEYVILNRHLVEDLKRLKMWTPAVREALKQNSGSVAGLHFIPQEIRDIYATVWESKQSWTVKHAVARAPFVDQSQSMNLFFETPTVEKISSALFFGWRNGLKTLNYYVHSRPVANMQTYSVMPGQPVEVESAPMVCRREAGCVSCSA